MSKHTSRNVNRRTVLKTAGGTGVTASLAGCSALFGDGDGDGDGTGDGGTATEGPGQIPDEPVQGGLLTYLSGAPAVLGIQAQRGAQLAQQRINEAGGIAGQRRLELDIADEAENALDKYNSFIDEGKEVTFGTISSGKHANLAPQVEDNEIVNVATDGTVTTLYEETVPDPTYSFRFQNHDVMETTTAALEAVQRIGADNVDTVAGINPGYSFGEDEMNLFTQAIQSLTGAEVVYNGTPDLGEPDMSTHIQAINEEEPDITFSSLWGGDVTTMVQQAASRGMFDNTTVVGTTLYSAADDVPASALEGAEIYSGSRNYYWDHPEVGRWSPGQDLFDAAQGQDDITVPTAHYLSGYGAVAAWATAAEKAVRILGGNEWPSQKQIAATLEEHGFFTPAGYHVISANHQGHSTSYSGQMVYDDDVGAAVLEDVNTFTPTQVSPPPGQTASDWIDSW